MEFRPYGKSCKNASYVKYKCLIDGYERWIRLGLLTEYKCVECKKREFLNKNSISNLRPDLIVYFKNKNDADNISISNGKKVDLICPSCGYEKSMVVSKLSSRGFSCGRCSDGISISEKFCLNLLIELGVEFEKQKRFDWAEGKVYDFYIPSLNLIIETHGAQHFIDHNFGNRSLEDEVKNDTFKKNIALKNNIFNYVEVDCRKSEYNWIKDEFFKSLKEFFDLTCIDFKNLFFKSQKSKLIEVCEYWNIKLESENVEYLAKKFNLGKTTVYKYLHLGHDLGLCFYEPKI